jgi:branched-chain amino acid transport system ATP-binding protein
VLRPSSGTITFAGHDVSRSRPDRNARLGMARTFQNIRLFNDLTVLDNVKAACHMRLGMGLFPTLLHLPGWVRSEQRIQAQAMDILDMLKLDRVAHETAANLPYGLQRRVEIGRALATRPSLLLLDEPAAGLNPQETQELIRTIRRIHSGHDAWPGIAVLLVEHDMNVVMSICPRIQVLVQGQVLTEGTPEEVQRDQRVVEAYLGAPKEAVRA